MAANRIKKGLVYRLSSGTAIASAYITHLDNSRDIFYVKADNGNDTSQNIKNESTSINDEEIKSDKCDSKIMGSEKCDFLISTHHILGI